MKLPLIKGDKVSSDIDYRDALPVNMYAVNREILGGNGYMICYPGLSLVATGDGIDRGGFYNDRFETQYRVSGTNLIKVNTNGTTTTLGTIPGTKQAAMSYSFNTQSVVADGKMFLYDATTGFRGVTDSDLGTPLDIVWVDGYYFLTDGEFIYHTNLSDESAIDPLKFATAEFMPDRSLGLGLTQDDKVIVFGRYSTEYFVNAATENFAFQRVESRAQKIGIVATHAKCESGGKWYITGGRRDDSLGVHIITVGGTEKASTREIDKILKQYTEPQLLDMRMECRTEDDTTFILVHLPNETLCFNESIAKTLGKSNAWTILKTDVAGDSPYRGINGVFDARLGEWIYGDKLTGNIGKLDESVFTHYGDTVEWLLYTPFAKLETFSIDEMELETLPGFAGSDDATVAVSLTYDGETYGKEWFQLYGSPNNRSQRFILRRLGYVADWVGFKLRGATKARMSFAVLELKGG
jgi:hypothetical protein